MAITRVVDIIKRVDAILHDVLGKNWPKEELLEWYNAALVAIISARPDAYAKFTSMPCKKGCRQTIPSDGLRLIRVDRNTGGKVIRPIPRKLLDEIDPDWMGADSPGDEAQHSVFDPKEPRAFYLYPAVTEGTMIDLVVANRPEKVVLTNFSTDPTVIAIDESFADPITDYILMRAFLKDSDVSGSASRAQVHATLYGQALNLKTSGDAEINPNG